MLSQYERGRPNGPRSWDYPRSYGEKVTDLEKTAISAVELFQRIKIEASKQRRLSEIDFDVNQYR